LLKDRDFIDSIEKLNLFVGASSHVDFSAEGVHVVVGDGLGDEVAGWSRLGCGALGNTIALKHWHELILYDLDISSYQTQVGIGEVLS
jgi:hypothetical protein